MNQKIWQSSENNAFLSEYVLFVRAQAGFAEENDPMLEFLQFLWYGIVERKG